MPPPPIDLGKKKEKGKRKGIGKLKKKKAIKPLKGGEFNGGCLKLEKKKNPVVGKVFWGGPPIVGPNFFFPPTLNRAEGLGFGGFFGGWLYSGKKFGWWVFL